MKSYLLFTFNILIFFIKITISLSITSKIFPIYKIALSPNLSQLYKNRNYNLIENNIKGIGLIFDKDSDINLIPQQLMKIIEQYYLHFEETIIDYTQNKNGYTELLLYYYYGGSESLHFIFEKNGISIPFKQLLIYEEEEMHRFKFMTKENQENIVIGKQLIELLDIDLSDINNFSINEKYISKIEDEA